MFQRVAGNKVTMRQEEDRCPYSLGFQRAVQLWTVLAFANCFSSSLGQSVTLCVTNLSNDGPGSLRQAISLVPAGGTITFSVSGTIILTNRELLITNNLSIIGPGAAQLAVSGNNSNRVFEIGTNASVTISGLTIWQGHAPDGGGYDDYSCTNGIPIAGCGGGVYNAGTLNLVGCAFRSNLAGYGGSVWIECVGGNFGGIGGSGGGICNSNVFYALGCTFSGNSAGAGGPGSYFDDMGHPDCTRGGNGGSGGGIFNHGSMWLTNCAFAGNSAGAGGPGGNTGPPYYSQCSSGVGGGGPDIYNAGTQTIGALPAAPSTLTGDIQANGTFRLAFTNTPGVSFSILRKTGSLYAPWVLWGAATESAPGRFQFVDFQAIGNAAAFYRVRSP